MMFNGPSIDFGLTWYHWCLQQHLKQNFQRNGTWFYGKPQVTQVTRRLGHVCGVVYSCSTHRAQDGCGSPCKLWGGIKQERLDLKDLKLLDTYLRAWYSELKWIFWCSKCFFGSNFMTNFFSASLRSVLSLLSISVGLEYPLWGIFHIYELDLFNNGNVANLKP